jgi:threonine/homoserine/homoserine lactone efflux protein
MLSSPARPDRITFGESIMTLAAMIVFLLAYATAVAIPGPGLAALLARVLARGTQGTAAFIGGFIVGDIVWFSVAAVGLAALAETLGTLFTIIRYAGAAYLLFIAYKLITAPAEPVDLDGATAEPTDALRDFGTSLMLQLGNPKAILFFMALLPSVVDLSTVTTETGLTLALIIGVTQAAILAAYTFTAARARRIFTSRRSVRALNVGTGTIIAGAAVAVASR